MPALLEARGLVKHLGGRRVVDGVDLVCHAGQVLGLLGPNGAGKTTTLRMLYGFLGLDAGRVTFEGVDVDADLSRYKRLLGVCTQGDTYDADFSVRQNLEIAASYFRPRPTGVRERVNELLDRFGLGPFADQRPETLSGGFKRRLMIARALVHRPQLLFLDEPTTGLDPQARMGVWDLIDALRTEGLGIVLTTHYMDEAERLSDYLTVLTQGRVATQGTPKSVMGDLLGEHVDAEAQLENRVRAARDGARDDAPDLRPRPRRLAGQHAVARPRGRLHELRRARHARVRDVHLVHVPGALRRVHPHALPAHLGGPAHHADRVRHVVWGEILWAGLLASLYVAIVSAVLVLCRAFDLVAFDLGMLPAAVPLAFLADCAFAALGLCFTALVPTIDHMNLPVFLFVLPVAFTSGTYFPITHPVVAGISQANPVYHLAEGLRGLLLGAPAAGHLFALGGISIVMLAVLVPLDIRLLRRRVLGE